MFKKFKPFISLKNSSVWIFLVAGLVLIVIGETHYLTELFVVSNPQVDWLNNTFKLTGTAIIGGGVVSSITQSSSFLELYKTQFEKVIWSKDFLKNRHDIRQVWSVVSNILYKEKFDELSEEIHDTISESYFPTAHDFYIDNLHINILIRLVEEKIYVKETWDFSLIPSKNQNSNSIKYSASRALYLYPNEVENESSIDFYNLLINGKEITLDKSNYEEYKNESVIRKQILLDLPSNQINKVTFASEKILLKERNRFSRMVASYFYNNLHVTLTCPNSLKVELHEAGTVKNFVKVSESSDAITNQYVWKYEGVLLPFQGYYLLYK